MIYDNIETSAPWDTNKIQSFPFFRPEGVELMTTSSHRYRETLNPKP